MAAVERSYPWVETSPGNFERPIDNIERMAFAWGNLTAPFHKKEITIYGIVRYRDESKDEDPNSKLRKAWQATRRKYPGIATTIKNDKRIYADDWDKWMTETFIISKETPEEIYAANTPVDRPRLYVFPQSTIMIKAPHEHVDGIGLFLFTGKFFELLANPGEDSGDVRNRLTTPYFEKAQVPKPSPESTNEAAETVQRLAQPSVHFKAKNLDKPPANGNFRSTSWSEADTKAIIKACKSTGNTVTAAVHAALLMALQSIEQPGSCSCLTPFNIRSQCTREADDFTVPCMTGDSVIVPQGDYKQTAAVLTEYYAKCKRYNLAAFEAACDLMIQVFNSPPPPTPPTVPGISSLGIAEKYMERSYGDIKIESYHPLLGLATTEPRSFLWTFRDQLNLNVMYNEQYYDAQFIDNFLAMIRKELGKGLGITWDS